jgi:hypothetical protein
MTSHMAARIRIVGAGPPKYALKYFGSMGEMYWLATGSGEADGAQ